jgi:hypothetical protein
MEWFVVVLVLASPFLFGFAWGIFKWQLKLWFIRRAQRIAMREAQKQARKAMGEIAERSKAPKEEPPPRDWLIPDLFPMGPQPRWRFSLRRLRVWKQVKGYISVVIGQGGVGKSYLLVSLAVAVATGREWLGWALEKRAVLYVDTELDAETFWQRVYAICRLMRVEVPKNLSYLRLYASLGSIDGMRAIYNERRRARAGLVILDSVSIGAWGVALSDSSAWNNIYSWLEYMGVPVVAIDHFGKDTSRGAVGTFMKQAKVRCVLELTEGEAGAVHAEHAKANFGKKQPAFAIQREWTATGAKFTRVEFPRTVSSAELPEEPDPYHIHEVGYVGAKPQPLPVEDVDALALLGGRE